MGNHYNGLPELCTGALDKPQHLGAGLAVKVAGRLVGQHNSRFGNQGAGDSHTLLLSAGKIVRHIFQFIFQPQQVNDLVQKLLIHRVPVQLHRQDNVLIHIQDRNKVIVLEDKADVAAAEDGKLFIVLLCQFFAPDDHGCRWWECPARPSCEAGWTCRCRRFPQRPQTRRPPRRSSRRQGRG